MDAACDANAAGRLWAELESGMSGILSIGGNWCGDTGGVVRLSDVAAEGGDSYTVKR
jgi:hypothetical protein